MRFECKIEPRDVWIGLYWTRKLHLERDWRGGVQQRWHELHCYICPLPMLVVHCWLPLWGSWKAGTMEPDELMGTPPSPPSWAKGARP